MATVAVIGGGISGLSTAYYLSKPAYSHLVKRVVLLEGSSRFGGWMKSRKNEDGSVTEEGPRSIRGYGEAGHNTLELVEELDLEGEVLPISSKHPAATNRYLYVNQKLHPLPKGLRGVLFRQPPFSQSMFSTVLKEPSKPRCELADESVHDFFSRRFSEDLAQYAVDPLCRGIFAGSSRKLSIRSCFPDIHNHEKEHGSVLRGMVSAMKNKKRRQPVSPLVARFQAGRWQLWSLRQGLGHLVDTMVNQLRQRPNVELLVETPCVSLEFPEGRAQVEELDLEGEVLAISSKHPAATNRYLYVNQKLHPLPKGLRGVLFRQPPFSQSMFSTVLKEPSKPRCELADESVHDFFSRRFSEDLAQYAVDPLCRGIFAGSSRKLSIRSCFPDIHNHEKEHGSVLRGMVSAMKNKKRRQPVSPLVARFQAGRWQLWSLRQGLGHLVDTMVNQLRQRPNVELLVETPCVSLEFPEGRAQVQTPQTTTDCDVVFSSCLSQNLSRMLPAVHQPLIDSLEAVPAVTVGVVSLQYPGKVLPAQGFGHLVPSSENSKVLGIIYDSCVFPEHDGAGEASTRLTCMMGGAWFEEVFGDENNVSSSTLSSVAMESVREQLGVVVEPLTVNASLLKDCIPQYLLGHADLLSSMDEYIKLHNLPLRIVGSSYRGVSVNDCILNAKKEADRYLAKLL